MNYRALHLNRARTERQTTWTLGRGSPEAGAPERKTIGIERGGIEVAMFDIPAGVSAERLQRAVLAVDAARFSEDQDSTALVLKIAHILMDAIRGTASIDT
jgi:hypothetical protein